MFYGKLFTNPSNARNRIWECLQGQPEARQMKQKHSGAQRNFLILERFMEVNGGISNFLDTLQQEGLFPLKSKLTEKKRRSHLMFCWEQHPDR
jgi:hypothetical protein